MEERYVIYRGRPIIVQRGSSLHGLLEEAWEEETSDNYWRSQLELKLFKLVSVVLGDYENSVKSEQVFVMGLDGLNLQGRWAKGEERSFLVTHRLNVCVEGRGWREEV